MYSRTLYPSAPSGSNLGPFSGAGTLLVPGRVVTGPDPFVGSAARYDARNLGSITQDSAGRVSLWGDISGNSADATGLYISGTTGNYAISPDSMALDFTGDIDVRVSARLRDWSPAGGSQVFVTKDNGTNRQWRFLVRGTGALRFVWWSTGHSASRLFVDSPIVPAANFAKLWVRVTLDVDNGAGGHTVTFYTSSDGTSWTVLGAPVIGAGVTTLFATNAPLVIGANGQHNANFVTGLLYRIQILNGINGPVIFDANPGLALKLASFFVESSPNAAIISVHTSGDVGARLSGARDLVQLTPANQPLYMPWSGQNYGYLNENVGVYFSSPNSAALNITGDIDLRAFVALDSWGADSPGKTFISHWVNPALGFVFQRNDGTGALRFYMSIDGVTPVDVISSVATGFAPFTANWVRVTRVKASGLVTFYTSSDGTSWTQLGTTFVLNAGSAIFAPAVNVGVGAYDNGSAGQLKGKIYRAQIYADLTGTDLRFDFNPATYVSGPTFLDSSPNAAVITINSTAVIIVRACLYSFSTSYLKAAAFALTQPETVYFVGEHETWADGNSLFDGNTALSGCFLESTASPQIFLYAGAASSGNSGLAIRKGGVVCAEFNAGSSLIRVNLTAPTGGAVGAGNMNGLTAFARADGSSPWNGEISELAVFPAAHNAATQNTFIQLLGAKWGIPV